MSCTQIRGTQIQGTWIFDCNLIKESHMDDKSKELDEKRYNLKSEIKRLESKMIYSLNDNIEEDLDELYYQLEKLDE